MSALIGGDRPLRVCDLCGGVDDHPRHSFVGQVPGQAIVPAPTDEIINRVLEAASPQDRARLLRDLNDVTTTDRHRDCCAAAGCPDAGDPLNGCDVLTAGAKGTGKAMLNNIIAKRADAPQTDTQEG